jgi:hypothetical protein
MPATASQHWSKARPPDTLGGPFRLEQVPASVVLGSLLSISIWQPWSEARPAITAPDGLFFISGGRCRLAAVSSPLIPVVAGRSTPSLNNYQHMPQEGTDGYGRRWAVQS